MLILYAITNDKSSCTAFILFHSWAPTQHHRWWQWYDCCHLLSGSLLLKTTTTGTASSSCGTSAVCLQHLRWLKQMLLSLHGWWRLTLKASQASTRYRWYWRCIFWSTFQSRCWGMYFNWTNQCSFELWLHLTFMCRPCVPVHRLCPSICLIQY